MDEEEIENGHGECHCQSFCDLILQIAEYLTFGVEKFNFLPREGNFLVTSISVQYIDHSTESPFSKKASLATELKLAWLSKVLNLL
jgi:hypothetical protein